jgi:hypothetical protein
MEQPRVTARPVVAGVFNILVGGASLLVLGGLGIAGFAGLASGGLPFFGLLLPLIGLPAIAVGGLAVAGGVFALQRKRWGWALAGSIAAAVIFHLLGIAAIVLIAVSKDEFTDE